MAETPQQHNPQTPKEPVSEKRELLKREEVRTMEKDIAKVREQQARTERERIAELKTHNIKPQAKPELKKREPSFMQPLPQQKPDVFAQKSEMEKDIAKVREQQARTERERIAELKTHNVEPVPFQQPPVFMQQKAVPPQKPEAEPGTMLSASLKIPPKPPTQEKPKRPLTRFEKLFIRLVIVNIILFMIFNILAFGFWYFFKQDATPLQPIPPVAQPQPQAPVQQPPVAFFEAVQHELVLQTPQQLLGKLQGFLAGDLAPGFLHVTLKTQGTAISLQQFLEGTAIVMPQELEEKLNDVMLFSFVSKDKKRLGFLTEFKDEQGASALLRSWEPSMEQDSGSFFALIASKGSAYTPFFRSTSYEGISIRFQTFSVIDFGIVYGIVGSKLLFTSSLESFLRTVDQLLLEQP